MEVETPSIIEELELAIKSGSEQRRVDTLRQVTDLFLQDSSRLSEDQIRVFDDVLCVLVQRVETQAKAELSRRLAPIDQAPVDVIQRLARDDEIVVAGTVLANSSRLTTSDLVEIASTKGQGHLLAISGRPNLASSVTDVIVDRGDAPVLRRLATNTTAQFSETGYSRIVAKADGDDSLAEAIGLRLDLPVHFLRELLRRATEAVRNRLMALAPPELQEEIQRVLTAIAGTVGKEAAFNPDYERAERLVDTLKMRGQLNDATVIDFATRKEMVETAAALAALASGSTDTILRILQGQRTDLVLIPCKAAEVGWKAAETVLRKRPVPITEPILDIARRDYAKLSVSSAQRTLRFLQVRDKAAAIKV
jgi:uncharacterized protein (DUF2336 family)